MNNAIHCTEYEYIVKNLERTCDNCAFDREGECINIYGMKLIITNILHCNNLYSPTIIKVFDATKTNNDDEKYKLFETHDILELYKWLLSYNKIIEVEKDIEKE